MFRKILLFLTLTVVSAVSLSAQESESKIVDFVADLIRPINVGDSSVLNLIGNVVFYHNGAVITCDSAIRYNDKRMDCFKRVVINQNTTFIYGDRAEYDGNINLARVFAPIIKIVDEDAVLYTYNASFNTLDNIAQYWGGGTMSQGDNLLESQRGFYYSDYRELVGVDEVQMQDPDYKMVSDSVVYNMNTEIARFYTKSFIWNSKGEILSAKKGLYERLTSDYRFTEEAFILTDDQQIWADSMDYNSISENAILRRDIQILDEEQNILAFGDYGEYWGETENAMLTIDPQLISFDPDPTQDSLYVRADTMFFYTFLYEYDVEKEGFPKSLGPPPLPDRVDVDDETEGEGASPETPIIPGEPGEEIILSDSTMTEGRRMDLDGEGLIDREPQLDSLGNPIPPPLPGDSLQMGEGPNLAEGAPEENENGDDVDSQTEDQEKVELTPAELKRLEKQEKKEAKKEEKRLKKEARQQRYREKLEARRAAKAGLTVVSDIGDDPRTDRTPTISQPGEGAQETGSEETIESSADAESFEDTDNETPFMDTDGTVASTGAAQKEGSAKETSGRPAQIGTETPANAQGTASSSTDDSVPGERIPGDNLTVGGIPGDSLNMGMMPGDSLYVEPAPTDSLQRVTVGLRNVRIFRTDLQAVADSLVGFSKDSTLHLYIDPVMWNENNQIFSDIMDIYTRNEELYQADFIGSPFMASELDEYHYNQVKGRLMQAWFRDNEIYRHDVIGNGQAYYYMEDDDTKDLTGFIVMECANMSFYIEDREMDHITFRDNVDGIMYPMDKIPLTQEVFLPGFQWFENGRPTLESVFNRTIRPSQRQEYETMPQPQFPLTDSIITDKERMINNGIWRERNDTLTPTAVEFIRILELGDEL